MCAATPYRPFRLSDYFSPDSLYFTKIDEIGVYFPPNKHESYDLKSPLDLPNLPKDVRRTGLLMLLEVPKKTSQGQKQ